MRQNKTRWVVGLFSTLCSVAAVGDGQTKSVQAGNAVLNAEASRIKAVLKIDPAKRFEVALPAGSPTGEASIREHAVAWHPLKKKFYLVADVVPLDSPRHPNTYNTELYLWSSPDLTVWTFHGLAVPKGTPEETYDGFGVASPAGMAFFCGKLWVPFSARRTPQFTRRSIGLAWSGDDPEQLPWSKTAAPVSDLDGEDDDPAVVALERDDRLHLYHRTTAGGYRIVHAASSEPEQPGSWPKARPVTVRTPDVRAQELTGVAYSHGWVHLFVIEHLLPSGIKIGHFAAREPDAIFSYAEPSHRFVEGQPSNMAYGGHLTPILQEGELIGLSWTVSQAGKRYGIEGHAANWQGDGNPPSSLLPKKEVTRAVTVDKRWLLFPVKNGGTKCKMEVRDGARVLRFFDIELAEGEPDWWAPLDVSGLGEPLVPKSGLGEPAPPAMDRKGKRLTLWADKLPASSKGLANVRTADEAVPKEGLYREALRPQFHFSARRGWLNDPNGLVFFSGEYHLFFQHNPYGIGWGNMHWGHAVSKDLVHWTELGEALYPDALGPMFSGSAVVDHANTSGFGKDDGKAPLVLIYTAAGNPATQCIAWSLDGRTFTKYAGNPVVKNITGGNRDPKVFWHAPTRRWIMALYVQRPEKLHTVELLSSPDLRAWRALSAVPGDADGGRFLYECPDLFELPVAGSAERRWVLFGADGQYAVGAFDGVTLKPEAERLKGHCGTAAYAAQTFSDMPDGRRVLIGWLQAPAPGMPFSQCLSLPQELGLVNTPEGVRLTHAPVKELNGLRELTRAFGPADLAAGGANPLAGFEAELVELRLACEVSADAVINLSLRGVPLRYNAAKQELTLARHTSPWPAKDGKLGLIIYLDRTCIEVFSQDGLLYAPAAVIPQADARKVTMTVEKGSAKGVRGEAHALRSCWN